MTDTPAAERLSHRIRELGGELLDRADQRPDPGWQEQLLERMMADERLRTGLLRFVDVLPALRRDRDVADHVAEYLGEHPPVLGVPLLDDLARWAIRHADGPIAAHLVAPAVRAAVNRMARRFIAGDNADSALRTLRRLHRRGMGFTLDLLGEATVSEAEADIYQRRCLDLLDRLAPEVARWPGRELLDTVSGRRSPRLNLSVKVTALASQIDPVDPDGSVETIKHRLRPILQRGRELGAFVTLDMEQYDTKDLTLRVFRELFGDKEFSDWPDVGLAMQAYLRDTPDDLAALIDWAKRRPAPVTVRLVRGAYWDYETVIARQNGWPVPVWEHKADTDACYEACAERLLDAYPHVETAFGTHNLRSVAHAMAAAEERGLSPAQYEMQMLYGMADAVKPAIVAMGRRLRVYCPFGELIPGMAYLVRRLLENTSSQSFGRMAMTGHGDADRLLAPPAPTDQARAAAVGEDPGAARDADKITQPDSLDRPYRHEPSRRFVGAAERDDQARAIADVRERLGEVCPLVIAGRRVETDETIASLNPSRPSEVVGVAASAGEAEADRAMAAATEAFERWRHTPADERADVLLRAADEMRRRRSELAAWEVFEAGKPWREADADVAEAIDFLSYYARQAVELATVVKLDVPGETDRYVREPRGPGAVIAPWNFPLAIVTGMTAAAVGAGNTVVVKPAPQTPVTAMRMVEVLEAAGLPPGVVNFLPGGDAAGEALVAHPMTHFVAFTGSEAAGKAIYEAGARVRPGQVHLKRVVAEMGGKNAMIVDADADLDDAVRGVVRSAFAYAGQKCSAASRVVVVADAYGPFRDRLIEAARSLVVGPADDPASFLGPVIDAEAKHRIEQAIERGRGEAELALRVETVGLGDGYFVGPTVFLDAPPDGFLGQEEIFGPVLAVMRADDFEQALRVANGTRYALTGGVYSRRPKHLDRAARAFRVGNVYLNRNITGSIVGRQPFGGMKMSGVGFKAGGPDYLLQFMEARTVTENTIRRGFAPGEGG